jgi:hypothetical protein
VASWWKDLGTMTDWPPNSRETIVDGIAKEAGGLSVDELARMRDEMLLGLLKIRAKYTPASASAHAD